MKLHLNKRHACLGMFMSMVCTPAIAISQPSIERLLITSSRGIINHSEMDAYIVNPSDHFSYNPAEVLIRIPGISFNGQGGQFQSYSIRGMSRQRIRTEFDGIPIFTERRAGNSLSFIPAGFIGSIEAIKGPQATLYGQEAMGGIVSVNRWQSNDAELHYGYHHNGNAHSVLFRTKQDRNYYALSYRTAQNSKAANHRILHTEFSQLAFLIAGQHQVSDYDLNFSLTYSDNDDLGKANKKYPAESTLYPTEQHVLSQLSLTHANGLFFQAYQHYQNWDSVIARPTRFTTTSYQSHTLGQILRLPWYTKLFSAQTGMEWIGRYGVKVFEMEQGTAGTLLVNAQQDNVAIFHELVFDVNVLDVELGLRYDKFWQSTQQDSRASIDQQRFSGHITLTYPWTDDWHGYYKIANGFRFATLSERFFTGETPRGKTLGNPHLRPEIAINHEIGAHYTKDVLGIQLAVYQNKIDNYIERYRLNPKLTSYRNLPSAQLYGAEFQLNWAATPQWQNSIGMHWQGSADQHNQPIEDVSATQLQAAMSYQLDWHKFELQHRFRLKQVDVAASEVSQPSAATWDLAYRYSPISKMSFGISIKNITNKLYQATADMDADWQPGRQFNVDLRWIF